MSVFSIQPYAHVGAIDSSSGDHNGRNWVIFLGYLTAGGWAGHYLGKNVFHFGPWISGFSGFVGVTAAFLSAETVLANFPVHE